MERRPSLMHPLLENLTDRVDSKFTLVSLAAKRARQINSYVNQLGEGLGTMWDEIWPLLLIGAVAAPIGLAIFRAGEQYAKRHGKLKRSG